MFLQVCVCPQGRRAWQGDVRGRDHARWGVHGRGGHVWQGRAWQRCMCGRGGMHGRGVCLAGGMHDGGACVAGWHAWQGGCVVGGHAWQGGMCATADTMGYGQ